LDSLLRSVVVVEPPFELGPRLASLVPGPALAVTPDHGAWERLLTRVDAWLPRTGVLAIQFVLLAVLAFGVMQFVTWAGSVGAVIGDVPYALQVLALSPAATYLPDIQALATQLGMWLVIGLAGWLFSQGILGGQQTAS
jgi:hypothetical protein